MLSKNISIKNYNTFRLDYKSEFFYFISSEDEAIEVIHETASSQNPLLILGGGSNLLFTADYKGTIIHPEIKRDKY